jgi:tetratricopeptide (TPR) repeat protein
VIPDIEQYLALCNRGAYREAYAFLRHLMDTQDYLSEVGDLHVMCANLELTINDDILKARESLDRARELGCRDMAAYYRTHGYVLYKAGEYESGIRDLEESVALNPTIVNLAMLGKALSSRGDERAKDIWRRVLEQAPESCLAYTYLGILAAKTGDKDKAILMARKAEEGHPTVQDIEEIAQLYAQVGDTETALKRFLEADRLGREPKGPLYAEIAACHFQLGNARAGREYLDRARGCDPDNITVKKIWDSYNDTGRNGGIPGTPY